MELVVCGTGAGDGAEACGAETGSGRGLGSICFNRLFL